MLRPQADCLPTRHSLLGRLKDWQDQESWREFFDTYWKLIYSVALKAGLNDAEAHDVVQETLVSLAKTMPRFKYDPSVCSFRTWLQHLARKRIIDHLRKRPSPANVVKRRAEETSRTAAIECVPDPRSLDLDAVWDQQWRETLLAHALTTLKGKVKPKQYQIFYLYVIKRLPIQEVARSLRVNVGQVYLAKHRISVQLKKEIKQLEAKLI